MGKNFNINLKEARLRAGFSQKEIAEKIAQQEQSIIQRFRPS